MRSACVARGSFEVRVRRASRAHGGAFDEAFVEESNRRVIGARRSVWRATRSTYAISMRRPQSHSRCVCGARVELTAAPSATPLMRKRTSRQVIGASRLGRRATRLTYAIRMCRPQQYSRCVCGARVARVELTAAPSATASVGIAGREFGSTCRSKQRP